MRARFLPTEVAGELCLRECVELRSAFQARGDRLSVRQLLVNASGPGRQPGRRRAQPLRPQRLEDGELTAGGAPAADRRLPESVRVRDRLRVVGDLRAMPAETEQSDAGGPEDRLSGTVWRAREPREHEPTRVGPARRHADERAL